MTRNKFIKRFTKRIVSKVAYWSDRDGLIAMAEAQAAAIYDNPFFADDREHLEACADEDMRYWDEG